MDVNVESESSVRIRWKRRENPAHVGRDA
jgi:hypothetical protein